MKLFIKPLNEKFNVTAGNYLRDTLVQHQAPISCSCMSGRSGTCQCNVVEGDVSAPNAAAGRIAAGNQVLACMSTSPSTGRNSSQRLPSVSTTSSTRRY